jgi:hypothetical protein
MELELEQLDPKGIDGGLRVFTDGVLTEDDVDDARDLWRLEGTSKTTCSVWGVYTGVSGASLDSTGIDRFNYRSCTQFQKMNHIDVLVQLHVRTNR